MKPILSIPLLLVFVLFINACDEPVEEDLAPQNLNLIEFLAAMPSDASPSNGRALPRPMVWGDCELFGSVVTNTAFKPENGHFDELYAGGNGFKDGIGLISDAKPGDQDFNGGRWHMNVLKAGVDPDKYMYACSVEDLDLNDFEPTDNYFECPMLPLRGKNG